MLSKSKDAIKHCRACGKEIAPKAKGCLGCGGDPKIGANNCGNCGAAIKNPNAIICTECGETLKDASDDPNSVLGNAAQRKNGKVLIKILCVMFVLAIIGGLSGKGSKMSLRGNEKIWASTAAGICKEEAMKEAKDIAKHDVSSYSDPDYTYNVIDDKTIEIIGKDIKFQNGFGAWTYLPYHCLFNIKDDTYSVRFEPSE